MRSCCYPHKRTEIDPVAAGQLIFYSVTSSALAIVSLVAICDRPRVTIGGRIMKSFRFSS